MLIVLNKNASAQELEALHDCLRRVGASVRSFPELSALSVEGELPDPELLSAFSAVAAVHTSQEPYRLADRSTHPQKTVVSVGSARLGEGLCLIAGPCAVENEDQLFTTARQVKQAGAAILRGGAFKPRTSPYEFQGLGAEGVRLLLEAGRAVDLPVVTEIVDIRQLELLGDIDLLQVGARNMQNFELLKELGRSKKPVLLKRGMAATLRELLLSAEYLLSEGNENVVLCERGLRSFDRCVRNTLDLSAVPVLHELTQLPVIVDPSHAVGKARFVPPMALAAAACGADGIMLEVHCDPFAARCDGGQALHCEEFSALAKKLFAVREAAL